MALVLGLFGVCALGFKRYAQGRTDSRLGDAGALTAAATRGGWLGALGRIAKRGLGRDGSMIEVLSTHYLGPKKSIAVVRVAGRLLVLGVSSDSINLITQLSGEDALADAGALGIEGLGLDEPAGPRLKAPAPARAASASAGAGATAAGAAVFSDLLRAERTKPAFANPSAHSAYAAAGISGQATGGAPGASKGGAGVRAQIRNRLEGLKQL
jgi:flagellar protein FliO/FliZ